MIFMNKKRENKNQNIEKRMTQFELNLRKK